ncbi:MAG TPA: hypothetical protein VGZ32_04255 [Actinocrinis sp.]|jgi:hypothetical protein|uniref:hypothetical protein n=1 Tax=Actinocrinis sp. TaxID=1920516 RepID=UPI002DDCA805|nr:hypothetical protein [Actinocrinis sp.]HEV3169523.1 hypothetical protein [Actinocrinis sp.]
MMRTTRAPDAFIDLVCADQELVRAEFDALMRECWPDDPTGPAPHPPAPRLRSTTTPDDTAWVPAADRAPVADHDGSERAPPPAHRRRAIRRW